MGMVAEMKGTNAIGDAAGRVWRHLRDTGPVTMTKLAKEMDIPRDLVMQAVGWLAREEKIDIEEDARSKTISLR